MTKNLRFRPDRSVALPLATRSSYELLPIGTRIHYHHRAGVARIMPLDRDRSEPCGWKIMEGTYKNEWTKIPGDMDFGAYAVREQFFHWPYDEKRRNKTVMVWPDDGFGWIIGIVRRSIGRSGQQSSSYNSWNGEYDYDPGFHASEMMVDLYVIKQMYDGTEYILCPMWAVSEVEDE